MLQTDVDAEAFNPGYRSANADDAGSHTSSAAARELVFLTFFLSCIYCVI